MAKKRAFLIILCGLTLMATALRFGYQVRVDGEILPGVYPPSVVRRCERQARQAAEEIARQPGQAGYTLIPTLCRQYARDGEQELARVMAASYDGVVTLYAAWAGDTYLGLTRSPDILYALEEEYLAQAAPPEVSAVYLSLPLSTRPVLSYPGAETDDMEVSAALRRAAQVLSVQDPNRLGLSAKG